MGEDVSSGRSIGRVVAQHCVDEVKERHTATEDGLVYVVECQRPGLLIVDPLDGLRHVLSVRMRALGSNYLPNLCVCDENASKQKYRYVWSKS